MKTLFIEAKSGADVALSKVQLAKLAGKIGIVATVQHLHKIKDVQEQLPESVVGGQVLGCDVSAAAKIKDKVDAFLYVGSGEFHPLGIAAETGKDVFCFNPFTKKLSKITEADLKDYRRCRKASMARFLSAGKIGILVSAKPGQSQLKKAKELAGKKDKEYFIFAFDTLNEVDLENFPFIECWVNTACPRIADKRTDMVNIGDIK